ncbi:3-phosphoshikimate 1-carboxyvinyltransferase [Enhydrobacter aerosaccus]|uniref:3-phosphoshikimate 1-carboxyvinyltransferase n=1 Tax=Enhydrobacter aerosaccus TaxID=225324 RepID=A0A1T4R9A7_9HYPH|nr:3-phosphoshikimate 1-carboxyvinyltransferase [Enhydrobacter aerosaccus]
MVGGRRAVFLPFSREPVLSASTAPLKLIAHPVARLTGKVRAPGDKSVSHRALMFGALAMGETVITGLLQGEDVLCTAAALRALGADISREQDVWRVRGFGVGGGREPDDVLDLGNSGTSARLLSGILASHPFTSFMTGDASLRRRPMQRVIEPLSRMGARFQSREGGRMPLAIVGTDEMVPIEYRLPVASAQVKSCILLAGLNTAGETTVIEPQATRDHTERMLRHFGAEVREAPVEGGHGKRITVVGWPELKARKIAVPGDPSSAAFAVVAACIRPDSDVLIENVGINPLRAGLYTTLVEMGADITFENRREVGGEPVADLHVRGGGLTGVEVPADRAPTMIDEYPILAVAAAFAEGTTRMLGLAELRAKESDRLSSVAAGLAANGVQHEVGAESLTVHGTGASPAGGGLVKTHLDHRIAMSFLVLGLGTREPVAVDDGSPIDTSFPGFMTQMNGLGAKIEAA